MSVALLTVGGARELAEWETAMPIHESLRINRAQVVVVDVQERLLPHISEHERVLAQSERLVLAARQMDLPVTVSEQYPQGLGHTHPMLRAAAADCETVTKMTFSVWRDDAARRQLVSRERQQVLLVGIETHVCVQQTALDLVRAGFDTVVCADAVGSRRSSDRAVALERMRHAGVDITTVEAALYELMNEAGTDLFKRILPLVK